MPHQTHQTPITIIQSHVNDWRKELNWSRESAAMTIVEAHVRIGNDKVSGIVFDPPTRDAFERARVNADRIFRWLDDQTKDNNLLPLNFLPSILAALPVERRVCLLNDLLRGSGVVVMALAIGANTLDAVTMLRSLIGECADATRAVADLVDGATRPELLVAQKELIEALGAAQAALDTVNTMLAKGGA